MATFPVLSSGAITQYPSPITIGQAAQVIRFLDGSDQRYLAQGTPLRSWEIRLDMLNEAEIQKVEEFFTLQRGDYSPFVFPDPFTGGDVQNCRLGAAALVSDFLGVDTSSTSFWVLETRS
ncbi:MAG: DUF2460 domain-containing protein [Bryobacteraceae bacterium]|jgi:hypothetical protein